MLIDDYLERWDVRERHEILVDAEPGAAYRAVREMDLARSLPIAVLFALRGAPGFITGKTRFSRRLTLGTFQEAGFTLLAEDPGTELVLGAVGRFWRPTGGILRVHRAGFIAHDEPGDAKGVINVHVGPTGSGRSRISTETRVLCTDEGARRRFLLYWRLVGPFSGLIRILMLRQVKKQAEDPVREAPV